MFNSARSVRGSVGGFILAVACAFAPATQADIVGTTRVEFKRNTTLRTPASYPELYRPTRAHEQLRTRVEGSTLEALVDALQLGLNLGALFDGNILAGIGAYREFREAVTSWGGRSGYAEGRMGVSYPHPQYNRMRIVFDATSDDDDILRPRTAPGNLPEAGIRLSTPITEWKHWRFVYDVDLALLSRYLAARGATREEFPFAFGFREDAAVTTLQCAQILVLDFRRVLEAPPAMRTTARYFATENMAAVPVYQQGVMSFAPEIAGGQPGWGEPFQYRTLDAVRDAFGKVRVNGQPYKLLHLDFKFESNRVLYGTSAPYRIEAVRSGPTSVWVTTGWGGIRPGAARDGSGRAYTTEGTGSAWADIDVTRTPAGRYVVTFIVTDREGRAVCHQAVHVRVANAPSITPGTGSN